MRFLFAIVLLCVSSQAALAESYGGIPDKFFGLIAQGKTAEAIDAAYATNPWMAKNTDQVTNLKAELSKLNGLVGKYAYHELLAEAKAGTRYAHLIYFVGFDRQPLRFELRLYRAGSDWRFQGISFDAKIIEDIDRLANQRIAN